MDTRYEGDKSTTVRNTARTVTTAPDANGFNFRPLASNTYGYHPKSVTTRCNPGAGLAAVAGLQAERAAEKAANEPPAYLQNNRPGSFIFLIIPPSPPPPPPPPPPPTSSHSLTRPHRHMDAPLYYDRPFLT